MRRVIADEWMSLDGVVQSPSYPDEDDSGGFRHGGWHSRYFDDVSMSRVVESVTGASAYLLGRGTYQIFAGHWPTASDDEQTLAGPLNERPKYVASTTLTEPLDWNNSHLLRGDAGAAVAELKRTDGGDIHVIGSPGLVRSLLDHDLVDELRIMIDPIVLGAGKRLFGDAATPHRFELADSHVCTTGALLTTYVRAAD
jgi:dihydrofolate reductase